MQQQHQPPPAVRTVAIPFADLKVSGGARSVLPPFDSNGGFGSDF
jgi:hypothetical protein